MCLTFTGRQGVAPLSFILALQHWFPQQVEAGIAGKLDLGARAHFHTGHMHVGHCALQLGAICKIHGRFSMMRDNVTEK